MTNEPNLNLTLPEISPATRRAIGLVLTGLLMGAMLVGLFATAFAGSSAEKVDDAPPVACLRAIDLGEDLRAAMDRTEDLTERARKALKRGYSARAVEIANAAIDEAYEVAQIAEARADARRECLGVSLEDEKDGPETDERDAHAPDSSVRSA